MDDPATESNLKGLRLKWRRTADCQTVGASNDVYTVDEDVRVADSTFPCSTTPQELFGGQLAAGDLIGWEEGKVCGQDPRDAGYARSEQTEPYEASVAPSSLFQSHARDVGGASSAADDHAAVTDLFIHGSKFAGLKMPWETPLMQQIFGDEVPSANLSMPMDWGSVSRPVLESVAAGVAEPVIPSSSKFQVFSYVKHKSDETYLQQRDRTLHNALVKWRFLIFLDLSRSEVGRQLLETDDDQVDIVLTSVMGVKSPNTILKRANALMLYYRWNAVDGSAPMLPFSETDIWRYVLEHPKVSGSASRSQSLLQALRFAHYVMGFDNALTCASSKRILGQAQIQLSGRSHTKQARPLTVEEVKLLHSIADGVSQPKIDRCIASNILLLLYGRCRVSDVNFVHEILHDVSGGTGFLEITTRFHKSARSLQQKALLLPILMGCSGVTAIPWVHAWIANRKACGLPTSGLVEGALLPAPCIGGKLEWLKRPLSPGELTNILKGFLQTDDGSVSSHSLKATTLSWVSKAEVPREQRRILGRHASEIKGADSFYSRDLSIGPVNSLQKVINMIREGTFCPDASRANFFPDAGKRATGTPSHVVMQPFTPAFLEAPQPSTPGLEPVGHGANLVPEQSAADQIEQPNVEVKSEAGWSLLEAGHRDEVIEVSSESECDSSESNSCDATSGEEGSIDLEGEGEAGNQDVLEAMDAGGAIHVAAKNMKTKVIHESRDAVRAHILDQDSFKETMLGEMTKCGRVMTENYMLITGDLYWPAKCRVCFKNRRGPAG
eukprot:s873_g17.t1